MNNSGTSLFDIAASYVLHTHKHIFLTGRAGTGKTTFLKSIKEQTSKNAVIVAPTGVAAINAGGVTIHSFFQLPFGSFIPGRQIGFSLSPGKGIDLHTLLKNIRFNKEKRKLIEELELLVIDEVSMLRADMLDAVDGILRYFRKKQEQPFGGVQLLYIGDMHQLPPVVSNEEWEMLRSYYQSMFFFDALVMHEARPLYIELDKIYRQTDERFIALLNNIRNNTATEQDLALLNKHYDPYFHPEQDDGYIILTSHNYKADKINQAALAKLDNETYVFEGMLSGDFNENALPVEKTMRLKQGAQIMFIRNDKGEQRRYYNGKIGVISKIKKEEIFVRFPNEREEIKLEQETWRNIRYQYNDRTDAIEEEELGSYRQYPVRLAWAVTIHKSQGLTFEKAVIDAAQSFAPGQVYVALSRLTSLSGLVLSSPINAAAISTEQRIALFSEENNVGYNIANELAEAQKEYLAERLLKSFDWDKVLQTFQEHHEQYNTIKLSHQGEAVAWSATMVREIIRLKEVSDKFAAQLKQLIVQGDYDGYAALNERLKAAGNYFQKEMDDLIHSWQKHFDVTKVKTKTKKYLKMLEPLHTVLLKKKQQVEQSVLLAEGMAGGKNISQLLQQYQKANIQIAPEQELGITIKEDSKTISLQLLQQGKNIEEIARERGLVRGTIEGHLLQYLTTGEVKLEHLVPKEKEPTIRAAVKKSGGKNINAIREMTGNACTYNEIKAVLIQISNEGNEKN